MLTFSSNLKTCSRVAVLITPGILWVESLFSTNFSAHNARGFACSALRSINPATYALKNLKVSPAALNQNSASNIPKVLSAEF